MGQIAGHRSIAVLTIAKVCVTAVAGLVATPTTSYAQARKIRPIVERDASAVARPESPLLLLVSIKKQRVRVFDVAGEIANSRISSGQPGFDTPTGVFSILEKNEHHESNIYEGASMPHMQRLTWSGIALHAGNVPGYRASHGCIRLPASFARTLFGMTKIGSRVVVTADELEPIPFSHPNLFKPLPVDAAPTNAQAIEPTKVAINDTSASPGSRTEMPNFLGVSPALAAAAARDAAKDPNGFAPADRPRSRAEADRAASEKQLRLQSALKSAEADKAAASEKAKVAVRAADDANQKMTSANQILAPLRAAVDAADRRRTQALQNFENFMRGKSTVVPSAKTGRAQPRPIPDDIEAEFEDAILDATIEADTARAELAAQELRFAAELAALSVAEASRSAALEAVKEAQARLRFAQNDVIDANKAAARRNKPISVFVSLKTERVYIRQGFEPLLEAPITISAPTRHVGTHVFSAMRYAADANVFDWRLVSAHIPTWENDDEDDDTSSRSRRKRADPSAPLSKDSSIRMARAALDAITIPPDILATISELARPGASLIISDRELPANENGLGTEFVVLTR
jgi:L,D-transpeptidase catalytic domain